MSQQPKRVLFTSTRSRLGLSSIVKGLLVSLREMGISVKVDILGDSVLEATHIRRTTGRICQCLAPNLLTQEQILYGYSLSLNSCELHFLVCNDLDYLLNNNDLLEKLDPVVVVLFDAEQDKKNNFEKLFKIAEKLNRYQKLGLIGNFNVSDQNEFEALNNSDKVKLLALIPQFEDGKFAGDSSLSVNRNPSLLTRNQILRLKSLVNNYIKFNDFRELYKQSRDVTYAKDTFSNQPSCRIAVADDSAFHLSFQDNVNLLREFGAEIKLFSPLAEPVLPKDIDAIYFPNSYMNLYAEEIEINKKLLLQIKESIYSGILAYFEGDSLAYSCGNLIFENGSSIPMLGVMNADVNYFESIESSVIKLKAECESIITNGNESCTAVSNNRLVLKGGEQFTRVFSSPEVSESSMAKTGISALTNLFCTSSLLHWGSNRNIAENFVRNASAIGKSEFSNKK